MATEDHFGIEVNQVLSDNVLWNLDSYDILGGVNYGQGGPINEPYHHVTLTNSQPAHAASFSLDTSKQSTMGEFTYVPEANGEGLDLFTYSHSVGDYFYSEQGEPPGHKNNGTTSNTATVTIEVGKAVRADIDIDLPQFNPDATQERSMWHTYDPTADAGDDELAIIKVNSDDDNNNLQEDRTELSDSGEHGEQQELVQAKLGYWLRDDAEIGDFTARFVVTTLGEQFIRIWDSVEKLQEYIPYTSTKNGTEIKLADLPEEVWIEGIAAGIVDLTLAINGPGTALFTEMVTPHGAPQAATSDSDTVKLNIFTFDLDIDSDNNNGQANPEGSDWEETLEDHEYGLGKLIVEGAPTLTPLVVRVSGGAPSLRVRFEFTEVTAAGTIKLWTTPQKTEQIQSFQEFTLEELGFENEEVVVYIEGVAENPQLKTLLGVEQAGRPDEFIGVTLIEGGSNYIGSDLVKYLVTTEDSFFYRLQFADPNDGQESQAIRNGLASRGVYSRADLKNFSLEPLNSIDLAEIGVPGEIATLLGPASGVPGFNAMLYQDFITGGDEQYILAFAGTDDFDDILDDLWQGLGLYSEQYEKAIEIGEALTDFIDPTSLIVTGHSLGGGLASAASRAGGITADTFNAAGLHEDTQALIVNPIIAPIDAYYIDWDILSFVQDNTPLIVPEALGTRELLDGPYDSEAAAAAVAFAIGQFTGTSWLSLAAGVAEVSSLGLSHRMNVVLYGLLVDEGLPEDILGTVDGGPYDFGID